MTANSAGKESFAVASAPGQRPKITSIFDFSAEALGQLRLWFEQNPPAVPITSVLGFSRFTASSATNNTQDTTSSTSYADLAGGSGPTLTGLPDGNYVVLFGAYMRNNTAAQSSAMSLQVNGTSAVDTDFAAVTSPAATAIDNISVARAVVKQLSNSGNNTLAAKYRVTGGTGTFQFRWLIALRYSNL